MEYRDESTSHDPEDPRGGGGVGGGPGTEAQENWKSAEASEKARARDEAAEPESETSGAFEGDVRS